MGFTLARSAQYAPSALRSPQQEAADKANHKHMKKLAIDPPILIGSEKQIKWAKAIASQFLFYSHAWEFTASDIDLVFEAQGKFAKFWIDNRPDQAMGGKCRIAVEKALEAIRLNQSAAIKSNQAIAEMTPAQLSAKIRRL